MRLAAGLALLGLVAAAATPDPPLQADAILLLIGDAGNPDRRGEPVLRALAREAARDPLRTVVLFLGDNVYPRGLPRPGTPGRPEAERRLAAQVDAVRLAGARAVFVPGNHDWDMDGEDGWNAVRRQAEFVRGRDAPGIEYLPQNGCPGPEIRDIGTQVRLLLLDTQWFLHAFDKPRDPGSACAADSEAEVKAALQRALLEAGERQVLVAAHHPLASGGPHGGLFTTRQHLFPLTDWKPWLWIPLPGIGSIYPAARKGGVSAQDLSSGKNERMRDVVRESFEVRRPLAWVSGHEHSLQVIAGNTPQFVLVSGAGIHGHTSPVRRIEGTRFAAAEAGFMRIVFAREAAPRLSVLVVDNKGNATERFGMDLK